MDRQMLLFRKSDVAGSVGCSGRVRGETRGSCLSPILYAKPSLFISTENTDRPAPIGERGRATGERPLHAGERPRLASRNVIDVIRGSRLARPELISFAALAEARQCFAQNGSFLLWYGLASRSRL